MTSKLLLLVAGKYLRANVYNGKFHLEELKQNQKGIKQGTDTRVKEND